MHKSRNLVVATVGALVVAATLAAGGTPASAAASQSFFSSFESGDPQPTWTNTVDGGKVVRCRRPEDDRHPRQRHRQGRRGHGQRRERRLRRGEGEPHRRRHLLEVARVRAHRLGRQYKLSEPVKVVLYALGSANDAPGRDPQDWTFQGSNDGHDVDDARHAGRPVVHRALPDEAVPGRERPGLPLLQARHHAEPRRRHRPARRVAALERRRHAAAGARDAEPRPARARSSAYNAKTNVGFTGVRALAVRRRADRRRPRLLVQQGLRRRRRGHAARRSCRT